MCNARNHPPGCTCGWGGDGHLGKRTDGNSYIYKEVSFNTNNFESYVNPNAKCPLCGKSVFFYQSPNGGRVFFDDLGPPWPKHPCTDSSNYINNYIPNNNYKQPKTDWKKKGWLPVTVENIEKNIITLKRIDSELKIIAEITTYGAVQYDFIIFVKRASIDTFLLSVYNLQVNYKFEFQLKKRKI